MFSVWFAGLFSVRQQNYGPSFHNILGKETPWVKEKNQRSFKVDPKLFWTAVECKKEGMN